jgi:allantoin racemase
VTTVQAAVSGIFDLVAAYEAKGACAGVRAAHVPVLALERPDARTRERVLDTARALVHETGAAAIVLGCAGMSTLRSDLERALPVPIVDGVPAAVRILESTLAPRRVK